LDHLIEAAAPVILSRLHQAARGLKLHFQKNSPPWKVRSGFKRVFWCVPPLCVDAVDLNALLLTGLFFFP